jgi:hypothetical protein
MFADAMDQMALGYEEPPRSEEDREAAIALLAEQFDAGCDLFSGRPLTGLDQLNWLLLQDQKEEYEGSFIELEYGDFS